MVWGGACVNVHVNLLGKWTRLCLCRYVRVDMGGVGWGGACVNVHVNFMSRSSGRLCPIHQYITC